MRNALPHLVNLAETVTGHALELRADGDVFVWGTREKREHLMPVLGAHCWEVIAYLRDRKHAVEVAEQIAREARA